MKTVLILAAMILGSATAQADIFDDLDKVKDLLGKSKYSCTAKTPFDGSFTAEAKTENAARADAENKCISAGVSWMFCDDIKCTKR